MKRPQPFSKEKLPQAFQDRQQTGAKLPGEIQAPLQIGEVSRYFSQS